MLAPSGSGPAHVILVVFATLGESQANEIAQLNFRSGSEDQSGEKRKKKIITKPDGKKGRIDQFLGRVVPGPDQGKREYLVIELKRPGLTITRKELDQVEDYMNAMLGQPDFLHTDTRWNFFLIASEYDKAVEARISQANRPRGIAQTAENYTLWVKTWAEVLRESDARTSLFRTSSRSKFLMTTLMRGLARLLSLLPSPNRLISHLWLNPILRSTA
ncbi:MAG TPA: hypothetical protein VF638_05005 [Sphingomonas sp.]|jgi:hypothetical protein